RFLWKIRNPEFGMRGSRAVRKHFKRSSLIRRLFPICLNSHHGAEAYRLEAGHGLVGRQEVQEGLGSIGIGAVFHDGGGVDHLAAHLSGGLVHHGQTGGEGVGGVDHAAVHGALRDLGGDLLHVGAVGQHAGTGQGLLIQTVVGEDLLGVLAHWNVAVAHGQEHIAAGQQPRQLVKGLDALGVALGNGQGHLVLQQVQAGGAIHQVQALGVLLAALGVQLVHLL
ncbi:hypothetical protein KMBAHK_KMBAHK_17495, partial [Dysosmobacter welbionis]